MNGEIHSKEPLNESEFNAFFLDLSGHELNEDQLEKRVHQFFESALFKQSSAEDKVLVAYYTEYVLAKLKKAPNAREEATRIRREGLAGLSKHQVAIHPFTDLQMALAYFEKGAKTVGDRISDQSTSIEQSNRMPLRGQRIWDSIVHHEAKRVVSEYQEQQDHRKLVRVVEDPLRNQTGISILRK